MGPFVLLAIGLLIAALFTYATRDRLQICYTVHSDAATYTQLYWTDGKAFTESDSVRGPVHAGATTHVCIVLNVAVRHGRLRIDPVAREGPFSLENVEIDWLGSLFPPATTVAMNGERLLSRHDAAARGNGYLATSIDPQFVWRFDARTPLKLYTVNLAVTALAVGLIVVFCGVRGWAAPAFDAQRFVWAAGLFGFYPAFLLIAWLADDFVNLMNGSRYAFCWCLVLVAVYLWGTGYDLIRRKSIPHLVAASLLIMIVGFDVWYRAGWTDRQLFARVSHDAYNWRVNRPLSKNIDNSSIHYYADFAKIESVIVPGAHFVSDLPTSYYVAAALPLYPRITLPHHNLVKQQYKTFLKALCGIGPDPNIERALGEVLSIEDSDTPLYVIVTLDPDNRNIAGSCLYTDYPQVKQRLAAISSLIYDGRYVKVFRLESGH